MKLEVKNLEKKFKDFTAVKSITFYINEGETLGLLGPNGCGKTTSIGMMLGLIKPSQGSVIINGLNIENNRTEVLGKMNFILVLIQPVSVKTNILSPQFNTPFDNIISSIVPTPSNFLTSRIIHFVTFTHIYA